MRLDSGQDHLTVAELLIAEYRRCRETRTKNGIGGEKVSVTPREDYRAMEEAGLGLIDERGFHLLPDGLVLVRQLETAVARFLASGASGLPIWDRSRRHLLLGGKVIKRFARPAPNQERLLDAFEAAGWAENIPDPLDRDFDVHPADRLRDAIKRLNLSVESGSIRFGRDGNGGVQWWLDGAR